MPALRCSYISVKINLVFFSVSSENTKQRPYWDIVSRIDDSYMDSTISVEAVVDAFEGMPVYDAGEESSGGGAGGGKGSVLGGMFKDLFDVTVGNQFGIKWDEVVKGWKRLFGADPKKLKEYAEKFRKVGTELLDAGYGLTSLPEGEYLLRSVNVNAGTLRDWTFGLIVVEAIDWQFFKQMLVLKSEDGKDIFDYGVDANVQADVYKSGESFEGMKRGDYTKEKREADRKKTDKFIKQFADLQSRAILPASASVKGKNFLDTISVDDTTFALLPKGDGVLFLLKVQGHPERRRLVKSELGSDVTPEEWEAAKADDEMVWNRQRRLYKFRLSAFRAERDNLQMAAQPDSEEEAASTEDVNITNGREGESARESWRKDASAFASKMMRGFRSGVSEE